MSREIEFRPFSDHDIQQARMDGIVAWGDGYKLSDNPYDKRTLLHDAWKRGFEDESTVRDKGGYPRVR